MKQVLQNLKTGHTELLDIPVPGCRPGYVLIATRCSLISAGTERMLVEFGQASLLAKARSQPERVRQVLEKIRTDGLMPTLETVFARLDQPLPLGYCNAGVVLAVGDGVRGFHPGDRVVSNGPHAEIVNVPQNLCARIPEGVSDEAAAFTVLAAVALQGVRLAQPTLGEKVAVIGLGVVGLITVQLLIANGCQVLGIDFNSGRAALARRLGAQVVDLSAGGDPVAAGLAFSQGRGMDAVVIAASTKSNEPVHQAALMSRKRGRIVLVGVSGLELSRAEFYEKELTFQVSCSYGPGRYDETYEDQGHDYPIGFVRWTEQRNFEAVLGLMADRKLDVEPLTSLRVPHAQAPEAYKSLVTDKSLLGVVLTYPETSAEQRTVSTNGHAPGRTSSTGTGSPVIGMIGAGNFARLVLLPLLAKNGVRLKTIASANDASATVAARKFGFAYATSDSRTILDDPEINTVFVITRHNTHARFVRDALLAGKHVFVEKPLALNREELAAIKAAAEERPDQQLMVGFNRRFSPLAVQAAEMLAQRVEPLSVVYTINAGAIPPNHWTQDPTLGGGRIIGEGCHFVDLVRFLVGHPIVNVTARMMGEAPGVMKRDDKMSILLDFADGSTGAIHYLANGSKSFPKERVELFGQGRVLVLDNFKMLRGFGWPNFHRRSLWRQDKGHAAEISAFLERVRSGGNWLIPWEVLAEVTKTTFVAVEKAAERVNPMD